MKQAAFASIFVLTMVLSACATHPDKIDPMVQPTTVYNEWTCERISLALIGNENELKRYVDNQQSKRTWDNVKMTAGLVLFWPTLFFIDGDGYDANKIAELRGEREALQKVAERERCDTFYGRV